MLRSGYLGIVFLKKSILAVVVGKGRATYSKWIRSKTNLLAALMAWINDYCESENQKIIATVFWSKSRQKEIAARLWLEQDIVPFIADEKESAVKLARYAAKQFNGDNSYTAKLTKTNRVVIQMLVRLSDYEEVSEPKAFRLLVKNAKKFKGRRACFISATPQGGGVAIMRHALMRLFELLEIQVEWHVLKNDPKIFEITKKKFHNVLQSVVEREVRLTTKEERLFEKWSKENYKILRPAIKSAEIVVIDDPQPCGLIPLIREDFPDKKIIYRSHIQLVAKLANRARTSQNRSWKFIWEKIKTSDLFITHPVESFVPKEMPDDKTILMGATADPLDGLNKELTDAQQEYYMRVFNKLLEEQGQSPLDRRRAYLVQIARFDPSKGIPDLLKAYLALYKKCKSKGVEWPQLVIAGNSSVDDPDGKPVLKYTMKLIGLPEFAEIKGDIKVLQTPHYDQLLNTLLRKCLIAYQLSYKEGFEFKVTEALMKGKPVIAYNSGGIPLQIRNKRSGYLVKQGDTEEVARLTYRLLTNKKLYQKMSVDAKRYVKADANTVHNALYWLFIFNNLLEGKLKVKRSLISDLVV